MKSWLSCGLVFALALVAAGSVHAAAPVADVPRLQLVGHMGGSSLAVAIHAGYGLVGQSSELAVVDLRDAQNPRRIAYLSLAANDIVVRGNYAYVTNRAGLAVVDLSQIARPRQVAFAPTTSALGAVAVAGNYAYATAPGAGLFIFDISAPTQLRQAGFVRRPQVEGVAVAGHYVYLAAAAGVQVVNVADAQQPVLGALVSTGRAVEDLVVADNYLYLSVMPGALVIAELADPAAPKLAGALELPTYTKKLQVVGESAYIANGNRGVAVVDVHDPHQPRLIAVTKVGALVTDLAAAGDRLVATDVLDGGLHVLAGADARPWAEVGAYRAPGVTTGVAVQGHYAYLATGEHGDITVVDNADPIRPASAGVYHTLERTARLHINGNRLYAYTERNAVEVLDITNRMQPVSLGAHELASGSHVVAVQNHLSYMGDAKGLIHIYDVSATGIPEEIGLFGAGSAVYDVAVTKSFLAAAAGAQGVFISYTTAATPLTPVERLAVPGDIRFVSAEDAAAYALSADGTLFMLSLSGPGYSRIANRLELGIKARAMILRDGRLYMAAGDDGVYVVDVNNASAPGAVTVFDTPGTALGLEVDENGVVVADGYAGMFALSMSVPPMDTAN